MLKLVIDKLGTKKWLLNGKLHRVDGPAVEFAGGGKEWWINGVRHREDGPAIEYPDGGKYWYKDGKLHREDGPAVELANGKESWLINGKKITKEDLLEMLPEDLKIKILFDEYFIKDK